jgi:hypothetical protein
LVLVDTHANPDTQRDNLAPDISVYADDNVPDADAKMDFFKMVLFIELELAETSDPFRDPEDPLPATVSENFRFENDSDISQFNRGELCSYTAAHAGSQFRVHTFFTYRYVDDLQDSFVARIAAARLLPGASTTYSAGGVRHHPPLLFVVCYLS